MIKSHKHRSLAIVTVGVALAALVTVLATLTVRKDRATVNVLFPTMMLRNAPTFVDPTNLNTIYEYYLLENLAAGLIRDDVSDPRGYRPVLAETWRQVDQFTWEFRLRPGLTWSDGQALTGEQIAKHLLSLRGRQSRHLAQLSEIKDVRVTDDGSTLTLVFEKPTNGGLLHEISLADAALVSDDNLTHGWQVSSGPYSVESYDHSNQSLVLRLNPQNPLASPTSPRLIRLFWIKDREAVLRAFSDDKADLYYQGTLGFRERAQILRRSAPQVYQGFPTSLCFFSFGPQHPLVRDRRARREFAMIVQAALRDLKISDDISFDNQFVPSDYAGRLPQQPLLHEEIVALRGQSLVVNVDPIFMQAPAVTERLRDFAATYGVELTFLFQNILASKGDHGEFALFQSFKGNQKDAIGSWNFLFSQDHGPLALFAGEVRALMAAAEAEQDDDRRTAKIQALHRQVLDEAYGVPFWMEAPAILASNRVGLSNVNRFDLRLRFYDILWK